MLPFLATDHPNAIPVTPITAGTLPEWLDAHPAHRDWLATTGFKADPGTFAFLPADGGECASVLASPVSGEPVWAFAALPMALPEGAYRLSLAAQDGSATDAALGWALGSYGFHAYKKPKRAAANLVWPRDADRGEVERLARSVFLARNLINTPAEDMGPAQLAEAVQAVAAAHGATLHIITGDELLRQNFPTIHLVGRASPREPRLIDLRWGDETAPKVTLVGKGVCFDSGGLDLKTQRRGCWR